MDKCIDSGKKRSPVLLMMEKKSFVSLLKDRVMQKYSKRNIKTAFIFDVGSLKIGLLLQSIIVVYMSQ